MTRFHFMRPAMTPLTKPKPVDLRLQVRAETRQQKREITAAAKREGKSVNKYFLWLHGQHMARLERKKR
jgi:predicted HicB family RNase H-like nuclease